MALTNVLVKNVPLAQQPKDLIGNPLSAHAYTIQLYGAFESIPQRTAAPSLQGYEDTWSPWVLGTIRQSVCQDEKGS